MDRVHVTAEDDIVETASPPLETSEVSQSDSMTEGLEQPSKRNRELKSILALSKEAKLDTNISHKRKSLDPKNSKLDGNKSIEDEQFVKRVRSEKSLKNSVNEGELGGSSVKEHDIDKNDKDQQNVSDSEEEDGTEMDLKLPSMHKDGKDAFCWRCHRVGTELVCETCPRSYHRKCLKQTISDTEHWQCPECVLILKAENVQTRSAALKSMTLEHLCSLLKFAVKRMMSCAGSEPFMNPVSDKDFPHYKKYIVQPMYLSLLNKNINSNFYGSTQAFEADAKWILHNSIIFNSYQSKLTSVAKAIVKICKQEMGEIEVCPSCYLNANTKPDFWFVQVCPKPHILVWAKLKGFPYWPAKAMCTNQAGMVDVRFFGAHNRAWVPFKECFLYSRKDPNSNKQKRNNIMECIKEVNVYIENLRGVYGEFNYAAFKVPFDPEQETKQIQILLPRYASKETKNGGKKSKISVKKEEKESSTNSDATEAERDLPSSNSEPAEMEGYGTDEDSQMEEPISKETKSFLLAVNFADNDDGKIENENDDDTQLSSTTEPEPDLKENGNDIEPIVDVLIKTPTKIDSRPPRKRHSADELKNKKTKIRRNSDQGSKNDNSKLLNPSYISPEKINKVDTIPENMEISLGNSSRSSFNITSNEATDNPDILPDADLKKKPVQVDVANMELSIVPKSSSTLIDRLMEKLSNPTQKLGDVQIPNKLETEEILQQYKDLVEKRNNLLSSSNSEPSTSAYSDDVDVETIEENSSSDAKESDECIPSSSAEAVVSTTVNGDFQDDNSTQAKESSPENVENADSNEETSTEQQVTDTKADEELSDQSIPLKNSDHSTSSLEDKPSTDEENIDISEVEIQKEKIPSPDQSSIKSPENAINEIEEIVEINGQIEPDVQIHMSSPILEQSLDTHIIEQPELSDDQDLTLEDTQIDEIDIRNIIHSSLNVSNRSTPDLKTPKVNIKKRKKTSPNNAEMSTNKQLKIVSIETILDKNAKKTVTIANTKGNKSQLPNNAQSPMDLLQIEIKNEPESEEEETYMDKKREYMSALNISARSEAKKDELRTRSMINENLSKVIDSVACHSNKETASTNESVRPSSRENGEIFVKSFAKITPANNYNNKVISRKTNVVINQDVPPLLARKMSIVKNRNETTSITTTAKTNLTSYSTATVSSVNKNQIPIVDGVVVLRQSTGMMNSLSALPPNQQINYNPSHSYVLVPASSQLANSSQSSANIPIQATTSNVQSSVNVYRPQIFVRRSNSLATTTASETPNVSSSGGNVSAAGPVRTRSVENEDDFEILSNLLPETVSRAMGELLCRPIPKLRPRPPGPLSASFDSGTPGTAGPVTAKLNAVSHRLSDYFRGMMVEFLGELDKTDNSESTVASLRLEIEALKHKHHVEMTEIRKNVSIVLKDIQRTIVHEREKIVEETRTSCEIETIKRIEDIKSKQWCANCMNEAQYYCCWNTSYCGYACQQKHWSKHMNDCVQKSGQSAASKSQTQVNRSLSSLKAAYNNVTQKPKVYLNRNNTSKSVRSLNPVIAKHLSNLETGHLEVAGPSFQNRTSPGFFVNKSKPMNMNNFGSLTTSPIILNQNLNNMYSKTIPSVGPTVISDNDSD